MDSIAKGGPGMELTRMFKKLCFGAFLAAMSSGTQSIATDFDRQSYIYSPREIGDNDAPVAVSGSSDQDCTSCGACDGNACDSCGLGWFRRDRDEMGCDSFGQYDTGLLGFGLIKQSEGCFDDFISPMTNPVYFEDPRQLTEARGIYIDHKLPYLNQIPNGGLPGGRIQLYAVQLRARLTENLSLIATKDGYVVSQSPVLDDGWADLSVGLKYSLLRDRSRGRLLSVGARFEMPTGMDRTRQGNGDGVFDFFLSGGTRLGQSAHFLTGSGFILPINSSAENQIFYWSNHLDKRIGASRFYAFTELNWYNFMKSGNAFPFPIQGGDLFNLGSVDVAGSNIVTNAYGLKYKPSRNLETGVAWEFPLTQTRGILDNRLTVDLILRY